MRTTLIASWLSFLTIVSWNAKGPQSLGSRFEGKQIEREALAMRFEGLPDVQSCASEFSHSLCQLRLPVECSSRFR